MSAGLVVHPLFVICGTVALVVALVVVLRGRAALRHTTLMAAWRWLLAVLVLWCGVWTATVLLDALPSGYADQLWYGVGVVALCPPIAVLGSRRPGARVWTWFVLVPLILVLGWPALTVWDDQWRPGDLRIEVPAMIGYALVLMMGAGNYLGTRFTFAAVLYGLGLLLLVAPFSAAVPAVFPAPETARALGTIGVGLAALSAWREGARSPAESGFDRLWNDFRDFFGIVWARRIQDRINHAAETEQWPVRLELDRLAWREGRVPPDVEARVEHAFRWLLRRFVDPEWINVRLGSTGMNAETST